MSFSFHVRVATAAAALAVASAEMDRVVQGQPVHEADRDSVLSAVKAQVEIVARAAEGKHIVLSVSGSLSWQGVAAGTATPQSDDFAITAANVNVNAYVVPADMTGQHLPALREA